MGPRREQRRDVGLGEQGIHRRRTAAGARAGQGAGGGGGGGGRGGGGGPARVVSRRAGAGSAARRAESAAARAFACSESYCADANRARTATGVVSGSAYRCTRVVSSGRRGSSGWLNWMRNATESTGSTVRTRGPTLSCTNNHTITLAVESSVTVTESYASRRSSWRLLFWSWIARTR